MKNLDIILKNNSNLFNFQLRELLRSKLFSYYFNKYKYLFDQNKTIGEIKYDYYYLIDILTKWPINKIRYESIKKVKDLINKEYLFDSLMELKMTYIARDVFPEKEKHQGEKYINFLIKDFYFNFLKEIKTPIKLFLLKYLGKNEVDFTLIDTIDHPRYKLIILNELFKNKKDIKKFKNKIKLHRNSISAISQLIYYSKKDFSIIPEFYKYKIIDEELIKDIEKNLTKKEKKELFIELIKNNIKIYRPLIKDIFELSELSSVLKEKKLTDKIKLLKETDQIKILKKFNKTKFKLKKKRLV